VFSIITKRPFWVNFLVAVFSGIAFLLLLFKGLGWMTHHGQYVQVPDVYKKPVEEAIDMLEDKGFDVVVQDTVYYDTLPLLSVVKQLPSPNEVVKYSRTIYLTINRDKPPMINVPDFKGQTYPMVSLQLRTLNLKMGDTTYRPDFAKGSVVEQLFQGQPLLPGTSLPYGSRVDFVLGGGLNDEEFPVPSLLGKTFTEAKYILDTSKYLLGAIVAMGPIEDSASAYIVRQFPLVKDQKGEIQRIRQGELVDLWISHDLSIIDSIERLYMVDTLRRR